MRRYRLFLSLSIFGQKHVEKHRFVQMIICLTLFLGFLDHPNMKFLSSFTHPLVDFLFFFMQLFSIQWKGMGTRSSQAFKQTKQNHKSTIKILMNRAWISWNVNDIKDLWLIYDTVCEKLLVFFGTIPHGFRRLWKMICMVLYCHLWNFIAPHYHSLM